MHKTEDLVLRGRQQGLPAPSCPVRRSSTETAALQAPPVNQGPQASSHDMQQQQQSCGSGNGSQTARTTADGYNESQSRSAVMKARRGGIQPPGKSRDHYLRMLIGYAT
ncbi:rabphilin-3A-like protein [Lates japonicus]|uniref:Rabphilin-3A-like protein n=1 Tax=Lates japonicus TaxID=270547 RepID=A0AAD3NKU3_LATJO|nr:rabphilin-3A-like protein [Lates japonicus]